MQSRVTMLLPPWDVLERQGEAAMLSAMRRRGDGLAPGLPGLRAQQQRVFDVVPKPVPWAAITREFDCHDAGGSQWLRADPVQLRVEAGGLRLMSFGDALALTEFESGELAAAIRPLFHAVGMLFSAPHPARWYVQLARGRPMPDFVDPESALGALEMHMPTGRTRAAEWMRVLNEVQMALHDHPVNRARAKRGEVPVNSIWLWGAGETPHKVVGAADALVGGDDELGALANAAGLSRHAELGEALQGSRAGVLLDARHSSRRRIMEAALAAHGAGDISELVLDSEDGTRVSHRRWHRFRFWR